MDASWRSVSSTMSLLILLSLYCLINDDSKKFSSWAHERCGFQSFSSMSLHAELSDGKLLFVDTLAELLCGLSPLQTIFRHNVGLSRWNNWNKSWENSMMWETKIYTDENNIVTESIVSTYRMWKNTFIKAAAGSFEIPSFQLPRKTSVLKSCCVVIVSRKNFFA